MKYNPKNTNLALMTTEKVTTSKDGQECYLYAQIETVTLASKITGKAQYKIRTDLVNYQPETYQEVVDNEVIESTRKCLTWVEQKEDWFIEELTIAEINELAALIKNDMPSGLTKVAQDDWQLNQIFKLKRIALNPWNINTWKIVEESDLIK